MFSISVKVFRAKYCGVSYISNKIESINYGRSRALPTVFVNRVPDSKHIYIYSIYKH